MAPRALGLLALLPICSAVPPLDTRAGPKPGVLNVHIIPHTHDDVGWLKTVDQYYMGLNNSIQSANVKLVLDSVVRGLARNRDRTFTYVEVAFFHRWWQQQDEATRELTRRLVREGQLSFANGGWCMHDEATPHYIDMIDQTTTGHRFLMRELNTSPTIGWQLDPFGHSATQAALLSAEVGFEGLFFGRLDYEDMAVRRAKKACEFIWRASPSLGPEAQVFTGLTGECQGNYGPPPGLDWDVFSQDEPIQDDSRLNDYNVNTRVEDFVKAAKELAGVTRGEHVMFTMGSDFQYREAESWFGNLDKIIHYANLDGRVNAFYSSPQAYVDAKKSEKALAWPLKTDDFFPYADGPHMFWTGYSTSRPALKRYVRETSAFLQVSKQLLALTGGAADELTPLLQAMGVLQHHDAVSGTEKQHVAFDYAQRLAAGRGAVEARVLKALAGLAGREKLELCQQLNVSVCAATQRMGKGLDFLLWNGLAQAREELVELPVEGAVRVLDAAGKEVASQLLRALPSVDNYGHPAGGAKSSVLFKAELPPLGFSSYRLESAAGEPLERSRPEEGAPVVLENEHLRVEFCPKRHVMTRATDKVNNLEVSLQQDWLFYKSFQGAGREGEQASGAYIFRPANATPTRVGEGVPTLEVTRGALADEVHQVFSPWVSQRVRLAKGARHLEITYTVGPVPVADGAGKEVVTTFRTDLKNKGESYTDSNGRDMVRRQRDVRPSWKYNVTDHGEPVAGNYYPVTTAAFIRDERAQLTVLTDRSQSGGGSVRDGEVELMVHRRLLRDDARGAGEPLNETEFVTPYVVKPGQAAAVGGHRSGPGLVVRGQHLLLVGAPDRAAADWRPLMDRAFMPPMPAFAPQAGAASFSALAEALPANVQLVTLEAVAPSTLMLRLAHQFGLGEDAALSKPVKLDLAKLLKGSRIVSVEEKGLTGTITRAEVLKRRPTWPIEGEPGTVEAAKEQGPSAEVVLGPLQIRTFYVKVAPKDLVV